MLEATRSPLLEASIYNYKDTVRYLVPKRYKKRDELDSFILYHSFLTLPL